MYMKNQCNMRTPTTVHVIVGFVTISHRQATEYGADDFINPANIQSLGLSSVQRCH